MTKNFELDAFALALNDGGLFPALAILNATSVYRFTGVYVFEGDMVKSVVLFDRKNPDLRIGENVKWKDSYCRLASEDGERFEIQDSLVDDRIRGHAARRTVQSYCAILLKSRSGKPLGTLCHFDLRSHLTPAGTMATLEKARPLIERYLRITGSAARFKAERSTAKSVKGAGSGA